MKRRRVGALTLLLVILGAATAAAQPSGSQTATARLVVSGFQGVLGPGVAAGEDEPLEDLAFRVLVENTGTVELSELEVVVEIGRNIASRGRSTLHQVLDGGEPACIARGDCQGDTWAVRSGGALPSGGIAGVAGTVPGEEAGWRGQNGIFPVKFSLRRYSRTLDEVTTAVVHLADTPMQKLQTTVVWPVDDRPWRGPDGTYPADVDRPIRPGGRIERIVSAAEAHRDDGILLAPAAHLLEDLADRADGFEESFVADGELRTRTVGADDQAAQRSARFLARLRALTSSLPFPFVSGPYADVDVAGLVDLGEPLSSLAGTALAEGRERAQALTGRQPDATTYLATTPLTRASLDLLPGDHVLLPYDYIDAPDLTRNPDLPYPLRTLRSRSGRRLTATVADPHLTELISDAATGNGHLLAVQRVIAETAMVHLERPGEAGRPLLVMPPLDWAPHPRLPSGLLDAFSSSTWMELTTPSGQAAASNAELDPAVLAGTPIGVANAIADQLRNTLEDLEALRGSLPDSVESLDGRTLGDLDVQLLRAPSAWHQGIEIQRAVELVGDVAETVNDAYGEVIVPDSAQITLTSDTGTIPVTVQRPRGAPIQVIVSVGGSGNLSWPEPSQTVTLQPEGSRTVAFETHASGPGRLPVTVKVTDTAGRRVLDESTIVVRSTAISGPALFIIGAVVLVLLLVGAVRRRSPRRPKLEVVSR